MCSWTASVARLQQTQEILGPKTKPEICYHLGVHVVSVDLKNSKTTNHPTLCKMDEHGCSMDHVFGGNRTISAPPHFIRFRTTISHFQKISPSNLKTMKNEEIFPQAARRIGRGTSESLGVFPSHPREAQSQAQTFRNPSRTAVPARPARPGPGTMSY